MGARVEALGPRIAVAEILATSPSPAQLAAAWPHSAALFDDGVLRDALPDVPELRAEREVEAAWQAFGAGEADKARGLATPHLAATDLRTRARALLVSGMIDAARAPVLALERLQRARDLPLEGRLGQSLKSLAALTIGGIHYEEEAWGEALRAYLTVKPTSGFWRSARTAMAWCQFHLGRPERSVAILKLLDGGLAGDPERALLAAIAVHHLGGVEQARLIVDAALEHSASKAWQRASATPERVLAAVVAQEPEARGFELPPETLARVVAGRAPVMLLGLELRAAQEAPDSPTMQRYVRALEARFEARVEQQVAAELERAASARQELEVLRPQLLPPDQIPARPR